MTVRDLTEADLDRAVDVLCAAFDDDPALRFLLPDDDTRRAVAPRLARASCRYAMAHGVAWCTDDVDAVALRRPPGAEDLDAWGVVTSGLAALPFLLGPAATWRLARADWETSRRHAAALSEPHWYLWNLAVRPDRQGTGLGSALMAHTFAQADHDGVPCYLETTNPRSLAIHRAHGFDVVAAGPIPGTPLTVWSMVRRARAARRQAA
jgi:GNAT superfamily N-acetyltransferase